MHLELFLPLKRLSILLSFLVFAGCTSQKQDRPSGAIQVKIPLMTDGSYKFQVVDLLSVDDLVELKGWAARFLLSPTQADSVLQGYSPKIRVVKNAAGVYVATDELSLQLLTVYYHLENLGMLDEAVGAKDVNTWPRTVAVNVNYIAKNGDGAKAENNALYSGELDALLFVPYTEDSLPIMVNAGIIAHEHFHSLFHKLFVRPLGNKYPGGAKPTLHSEEENKLMAAFGVVGGEFSQHNIERSFGDKSMVESEDYHSYMLRGLNEGLADFWGWLYSADVDFVGQSLPQFSSKRKLVGEDSIPTDYCFGLSLTYNKERDKEFPGPVAKAYRYGSSVARTLKNFSQDYQKSRGLSHQSMRAQIGSALLKSVIGLKEAYAKLEPEQTLGTRQLLEILSGNLGDLSSEEVTLLKPVPTPSSNKEIKLCR